MAALLFISFIVLLLIGVPVAFAIAAAALLVLLKGDVKLLILVQRMFASTDSFSLIAVPFFIFAGDLLDGDGLARLGHRQRHHLSSTPLCHNISHPAQRSVRFLRSGEVSMPVSQS